MLQASPGRFPQKGKFDFSRNNNVAEFVKIAREEGLWLILRPSPYVCAEWKFGGYPYWLQNEKGLIVRSKEAQYLKEYETYIKEVGKQLTPLQINTAAISWFRLNHICFQSETWDELTLGHTCLKNNKGINQGVYV